VPGCAMLEQGEYVDTSRHVAGRHPPRLGFWHKVSSLKLDSALHSTGRVPLKLLVSRSRLVKLDSALHSTGRVPLRVLLDRSLHQGSSHCMVSQRGANHMFKCMLEPYIGQVVAVTNQHNNLAEQQRRGRGA